MNHVASFALVVLAAAVAAGCSKREGEPPAAPAATTTAAKPAPADGGIDWVRAAGDAEVDADFARAKSDGKPGATPKKGHNLDGDKTHDHGHSHGPGGHTHSHGDGGQTPSTSPPRMTRSDCVSRASSWP